MSLLTFQLHDIEVSYVHIGNNQDGMPYIHAIPGPETRRDLRDKILTKIGLENNNRIPLYVRAMRYPYSNSSVTIRNGESSKTVDTCTFAKDYDEMRLRGVFEATVEIPDRPPESKLPLYIVVVAMKLQGDTFDCYDKTSIDEYDELVAID